MTLSVALLLVILVLAVILFSVEWLPADVVALGVLLALVLSGLLPAGQALSSFGSETVLVMLGLLILTASLAHTGVVELLSRTLLRWVGTRPAWILPATMAAGATLSAVMSNTAATALLLPLVVGIARQARLSLSRVLMPLAFANILSSSVTLIATSTNIVISGLMVQHGLAPMGVLELTPVGLPILLVGIAYMLSIGQRLIPDRPAPASLSEDFDLRPYLTEVVILPGSPLAGKSLAEAALGRDLDVTVLRIRRNGRDIAAQADISLLEGDVLVVEGSRKTILAVKERRGIDLHADVKFSDPDLHSADAELAEMLLLPGSPLLGRSLKQLHFREKYSLQVLAIHRRESVIHQRISQIPLRLGDVLLVQGSRQQIVLLQDALLQKLGVVEHRPIKRRQAGLCALIFAGVLLAGALDLLPLAIAVLLGAFLVFLTGCIAPDEAYRQVEWRVLILIACMLSLGRAMEASGAAAFLAAQITHLSGGAHPLWLLAAFFGLTVALTQPMSNQAAAAVVLPVAIRLAQQMGLNPRTFAMMIAVAASTSYITPLEPACLLVYGPGRYRFMDFARVGSLLTALIFAVAMLLVPLLWPL